MELSADFAELDTLSGQLERLELDSNTAFTKAQQILGKFSTCSLRIGEGVQKLAQSLEVARTNAEKAAELVATRAVAVRQRQDENERLAEQFAAITEQVKKVATIVAQLRKPEGEQYSPEERAALPQQMAPLEELMERLVAEARRIKLAARDASLTSLQREADSLEQSISSARQRLSASLQATSAADAAFTTLARPNSIN